MNLTDADWEEIESATEFDQDNPPQNPAEWAECLEAMQDKHAAVLSGMYDDYEGEIEAADSDTMEWAEHLGSIITTIQESL
jgi:hypothetical protein